MAFVVESEANLPPRRTPRSRPDVNHLVREADLADSLPEKVTRESPILERSSSCCQRDGRASVVRERTSSESSRSWGDASR